MNPQLKKVIFLSSAVYFVNGLFLPVYYQILMSRGIAQFGILLGLVSIGSIASAYVVGRLSDSRNSIRVLALVLVIQSCVIALYAGNWNIGMFYVLQFAFGSLGMAIITVLQSLVSKNSSGKEGRGMGTFNAFTQSFLGLGMIAGGFLVSAIGMSTSIESIAALLVGVGIYLLWASRKKSDVS